MQPLPHARASASRLAAVRYLLPLALLAAPLGAQGPGRDTVNHESNTWVAYNGSHDWSARWGVYVEAQLRRAAFTAQPEQALGRLALRHHLRRTVTVTAGYAFQHTSPHGDFSDPIAVPEHRVWEQVELEGSLGRVALEPRLRVEHRFEREVDDSGDEPALAGWQYRNRARLQLRATVPLHADTADAPGWYLTATEEPFVHFGANVEGRAFDQNRAFVGVRRRWSDALHVEVGYLNQWDEQPSGRARELGHVLQVVVSSSAKLGGAR